MSSSLSGIIGVAIGAVFWGSNFIVLKGYDGLPDDGLHFVSLMATGVLLVGIATLFSSPVERGDFEVVFSPDGILGGAIWAVGNLLTVPIVKRLGLGLGLAIWAAVNLVVAFIAGMVGLGSLMEAEDIGNPALGALGVACAVAAVALFATVQPTLDKEPAVGGAGAPNGHDLEAKLLRAGAEAAAAGENRALSASGAAAAAPGDAGAEFRLGVCLAVGAGVLYGVQFVPLRVWDDKVLARGNSWITRALDFHVAPDGGLFAQLTSLSLSLASHRRPPKLPRAPRVNELTGDGVRDDLRQGNIVGREHCAAVLLLAGRRNLPRLVPGVRRLLRQVRRKRRHGATGIGARVRRLRGHVGRGLRRGRARYRGAWQRRRGDPGGELCAARQLVLERALLQGDRGRGQPPGLLRRLRPQCGRVGSHFPLQRLSARLECSNREVGYFLNSKPRSVMLLRTTKVLFLCSWTLDQRQKMENCPHFRRE